MERPLLPPPPDDYIYELPSPLQQKRLKEYSKALRESFCNKGCIYFSKTSALCAAIGSERTQLITAVSGLCTRAVNDRRQAGEMTLEGFIPGRSNRSI